MYVPEFFCIKTFQIDKLEAFSLGKTKALGLVNVKVLFCKVVIADEIYKL